MSTGDFQTQYASVMESMLKSAIGETTKLFETMVNELRAENSRIKKENEDLRARCSQFEEKQSTVYSREGPAPPQPCSEKRDTAVQCDLVPLRTMRVETCESLEYSSLQIEQQLCSQWEMENSLQDHNYGNANSQMTLMLVKEEESYDDLSLLPFIKQEDVEPGVFCGKVSNAARATAFENENEGSLIDKMCSPGEMFANAEETRVTLELRCHGMDNDLERAQNQLSEPEHPLVIAIKCDTGDKTEGQLVTPEEQTFVTAQQQSMVELQKEQLSVVPQQCHRDVEMSISEQTDANVQCTEEHLPTPTTQNIEIACKEKKNGIAKSDANAQPVRRRRGRPPKKVKHLQQPVKETDITAEQDVVNYPLVRVEEVQVSSAIDKVDTSETAAPVSPNKLNIINPSALQETVESAVRDVESSELGSLPLTVESLTRRCSSDREKTSGSQECSMEMEAPPTENSSATETLNSPPESPQASPVGHRERCSSVTLQDAMLLVEAMNLSSGGNLLSPVKGIMESPQTQCDPHMDTLQTMDKVPAEPQTPTLSSVTCDAAGSPAITLLSKTQSTVQTLSTGPQVSDSHSTNKPKAHIKIVIQNHLVTASNIATQQMPSSTCETQTSEESQQPFPRPVIRWLTSSKPSKAKSNTIIVVPRPEGLLMPYQFAGLFPAQPPTLVSTIVAAQDNSLLSSSAERPSFSCLPYLSQESISSVVGQTAEVSAISSQKKDNTSFNIGSPKQTACVFETTNVPKTRFSLMLVPNKFLPTSVSRLEQKLSAVVRLTRLPISVSMKESVLVSRLLSNGFHESDSVFREGATQGRLTVDILQRPSEMQVTSTNTCPSLKEIEDSVSFNTSQTKEKNNDQDMYDSKYVLPPTPPKVSASALDISTEAISKPSAVEPISNSEKEIFSNAMQGCASSSNAPIAEKGSANLIQLTSIPPKDKSDPRLEMSKTQFLAQLAVLPVVQAPKKASFNDVADTGAPSAETSTRGRKRLEKNTLMARLRSHLKTHLHTRRSERKPYPCTETTTVSPKKHRLQNENPNTTAEPIFVEPKKSGFVEDIASRDKAGNASIPNSPRTGLCRDPRPKRSVSEPTTRSKATSETTPKSGRRTSSGRGSVSSKTVKYSSVTRGRPRSTKDGSNPKQTDGGVTLKNTKPTTNRISSSKDGATLKQTKSSPVSAKRSRSTREQSSLKKSESSATPPRKSSLRENVAKFKIEMITVSHRSSFTQHCSSTRQIKRESSPFTICRKTTDIAGPKSQSGSSRVCCPKLAKDGVSPGKSVETTPAKKARLIKEVTRPEKNSSVLKGKKIAKAARVTTSAKLKNSNQSKLPNAAKPRQLTEKTYKTQAVWIPPTISASRTSAGGNASPLPIKKETISTRPQSHIAIYQPSVSLNPIPPKAPSMVSQLQPLSVIGGRLLKNQCGECGRILSSSAALESHVSLHSGCRPFSCTLCGKSFPDSKGLKRHSRVHRNGKIHICQECGKGFVYRFGLTKHLQMVHIKIKPFACQICNKSFFTKRDVEAHIRIHTGEKPFECNLCERRFTRRVELNVHLRWHNGEKRHWCSYCGKGFLDLNNLKRHHHIHTGEKPHSCPHCPKHFTQSGHLKKHVKNVHKIH